MFNIFSKCAGVIVIRSSDYATVLVKTFGKYSLLSFPKGKIDNIIPQRDNNSIEYKETILEAAFRELLEETGITGNMLTYSKYPLFEYNKKGNVNITYLIGILNPDIHDLTNYDFKPTDKTEISSVKWYKPKTIYFLSESVFPNLENKFIIKLSNILKMKIYFLHMNMN